MLTVNNLKGEVLPVWTIDFETFYDTANKYSLAAKGMTTVQYVRSELFRAHGCSYVSPDGVSGWVTHDDLVSWLNSIDWTNSAMLGHNLAFDAFIAHEVYEVKANYYLDTMCIATGEHGPGVKNRLTDIANRLELERDKITGELEKTDGVRVLSKTQEEALSPYAIRDSELTREAFEKYYFDLGFPEKELHVIDITLKTFVNPKLEIDAALCRAEIEQEDIRMKALFESDLIKDATLSEPCNKILQNKGIVGLLRSRPCFAQLLLSRGVNPPMKDKIKNGQVVIGEKTYAFAKNDVELISLIDDPRVGDLVSAWTGGKSTIRKTRAQRFLDVTEEGTKTLPIPLRYCGGRTHRWSGGGSDSETGSNPWNPQNLSAGRDGRGSRLREAIIAPKGFRVISCDSSQIECRVHAWVWEDDDLLNTFRNNLDPYSKLAKEIFNVPVSKNENVHLRYVGKSAELGLSFGIGAAKFLVTVQNEFRQNGFNPEEFTENDALKVVQFYRQKRRTIVEGWYKLGDFIKLMCAKQAVFDFKIFQFRNDKVYMPNGLPIHYTNIHWNYNKEYNRGEYIYSFKNEWTRIHGPKMSENFTQSVARSIVAEQALEISKELPIVLLVHDEIVTLAPENEADDALKFMVDCMSKAPSWCEDLPLGAEGSHKKCYSK